MDKEFLELDRYNLNRKMFKIKWWVKLFSLIMFFVDAAFAGLDISLNNYGHATFMVLSAFWMSKMYFDDDWS